MVSADLGTVFALQDGSRALLRETPEYWAIGDNMDNKKFQEFLDFTDEQAIAEIEAVIPAEYQEIVKAGYRMSREVEKLEPALVLKVTLNTYQEMADEGLVTPMLKKEE
jgi:hypothetical protein